MSDSVWPHRRQLTRLLCPWASPGKNTGVGCHFLLQCRKVKSESEVIQSCPTLSGSHGLQPTRLLYPWYFPGKSTRVGFHCLLQVECYSAILKKKKNETMQSAATWMDTKIIILKKVRERQIWCHLYVESKKKKRYKLTSLQNRNRTTDIKNKLMVTKKERRCTFRCTHKTNTTF